MGDDLDYLATNTAYWSGRDGGERELARQRWAADEPTWGIFDVPEADIGLLPSDVEGLETVELGCGTGYVSAWLARRGARPIGVDPTPNQLAIARSSQREHGLRFPLVRAAGERVPLKDASVDLVISEYGAAIWADPYRWIPEAARLLRPGGELVFLGNSTLLMLCAPDDEEAPAENVMLRDHFGMYRFDWPDDPCIEFHLGHGDWIRLLRREGFEIEDLIEVRPRPGATSGYAYVPYDWARRWPAEEVWKARKTR